MFFVRYTRPAVTSDEPKTVKDLLDNPNFRFSALRDGATFRFLQKSPMNVHNRLFRRLTSRAGRLWPTLQDGVDFLEGQGEEGDDFGLIMENSAAADVVGRSGCNLRAVGTLDSGTSFALAFPKGESHFLWLKNPLSSSS